MTENRKNGPLSRSARFERSEDVPTNPSWAPTFGDVVSARYGRRDIVRGVLGVGAMAALMSGGALSPLRKAEAATDGTARFDFDELAAGVDETHHVAPGYRADILLRWGDAVMPDAPEFDPMNQKDWAQERQFGYNNDFIGYVPLPSAKGGSDRGLLCVNHEYTSQELMFPAFEGDTADTVAVEMAAHGCSVVEIARGADGAWQPVLGRYNRRITAKTPMRISGPAAGHSRMRTKGDPSGYRVLGTINNCAGGMTPWGTYLTAEENFHGYFSGEALPDDHRERRNHDRYGVPGGWYGWGTFEPRFDVGREPNEANRFGWIVEIDPYDPASTPIKRTALGRFKHEGAGPIVNGDGRVVVYMGDDQRFDYLYKFVSHGRFDPKDRTANMGLLDSGQLFVARFDEDGTVSWLPLTFGAGPLVAENGFRSQADVLIEARLAADLLGATPMDRPEDVEPNPVTGKVYVMLTNNSKRDASDTIPANPRGPNPHGHIVELTPPDGDHAALHCRWDILVKCGDPSNPADEATFHAETTESGWFGDPDNCAIDAKGRLWIATDGNSDKDTGRSDGIWAMETEGELRGLSRHFFRCPVGAELCGPVTSPDLTTFFAAVQHPGDGGEEWSRFGRPSTFEDPATRWPDFRNDMPPRPSVVAIRKEDGGEIG